MASTLTRILVHATFSTKNRDPLIPPSIEPDLFAFIGGICRNLDSPMLVIGGTADHVHLLLSLGKSITLSDLMMNIKRDSSKWMKPHGVASFGWQDGYFAFSIGESGVEALTRYIRSQKAHHEHVGFKEEMRTFFRKYGIEWDEKYVWA